MKLEITKLTERVNRLNASHEYSLTSEENYMAQMFWIQLNFRPEEAQEYLALDKRQEDLYKKYCEAADRGQLDNRLTKAEFAEEAALGKQLSRTLHGEGGTFSGGVMGRVKRNRAMRIRLWPEFAPRYLRYKKLAENPSEQLTNEETKELETILEWFNELQQKALGT